MVMCLLRCLWLFIAYFNISIIASPFQGVPKTLANKKPKTPVLPATSPFSNFSYAKIV